MFRKIDDWIIDQVFQKISDALVRWMSCYAIAAFLLTGTILLRITAHMFDGYWALLFFDAIWLPFRLLDAHTMDREPVRDVLPIERIAWMPGRFFWLSLAVLGFPVFFLQRDHAVLALESGDWLLVMALFFMACRRRPPAQQKSRAPWFAWLRPVPA
jgi:hypothetical protein